MRSSLLDVLICILLVKVSKSEKITFENVTFRWRVDNELIESVATSESLKKIIPDVTKVSVHILGHVPILYEKSIFDIPNLNGLNLSDVGLEEIESQAFGNLPPLENLLLSWNNLTQIKTDTFSDLNVSNVDLSFNSITLLEPGAFKNFNASIVSLDSNRLTELLSGVFENVTLGSLSLNDNLLHTIPPTALSSIGLTKLYLLGNNFEEIDPEVFDLQELVSLDLDYNSIKLLRPGDLRNLPELKKLWLSGNELEEIPEGVFNNTKLIYLYLAANNIVKIASKAFEDMSALRVLNIDFNNVTH